jgi:recombination protein RecA
MMSTEKKPPASTKKSKIVPAKNLSALTRARAALKVVLKEDHVTPLSDNIFKTSMPHIPTGSLIIDYLIGGRPNQFGVAPCPGTPRGRILNLYGNPGAGKTTLALTTAASICNVGGTCVYIDWENEVEPRYAAALGVPVQDESRFLLMQPNTMEEGMKIMVQMASEGVDLIVVDSVGAGVPEDLYNRAVDDEGKVTRIGLVAAKWSQFLPKFKSLAAKSNTAVIGISQLRKTIDKSGHGPDSAAQGGEAWKYYSAVRMMLRVYSKDKVKQFNAITGKPEDIVVGTTVVAKLDKCKVSDSVHHEQKFYLKSGKGIDNNRSVVDLAVTYKIITKSGSWYEWPAAPGGSIRGQGMDGVIKLISERKGALQTLFSQVIPKLTSTPTAEQLASLEEEEVSDDIFEGIVPATKAQTEKTGDASLDEAEDEDLPAAFRTELEPESEEND